MATSRTKSGGRAKVGAASRSAAAGKARSAPARAGKGKASATKTSKDTSRKSKVGKDKAGKGKSGRAERGATGGIASRSRAERGKARTTARAKRSSGLGRSAGAATHEALDFALLGCSDEAVRKGTGHGWAHWIGVLDGFGVKAKGHAAAAAHLHSTHRVPGWWHQMIVVGYERHRGLRAVGQKADGFSASASRTIEASADAVFGWFEDAGRAARWLPKGVTVHKSTKPRSARMTWTDGTKVVSAWIGEKKGADGRARTAVQIEHNRLPDADSAERTKEVWSESLGRLKACCEG